VLEKILFAGENMDQQDLINSIRDNLGQYRYTEPLETLSIKGVDGVLLATPRRMMVRYLCGVFALPDSCNTPEQAKKLFDAVRIDLTKHYARFPYWKELGTYLVWICGSELFDGMQGKMTQFKDKTGLHMNVMLGTVLVDREKFMSSAESTWGLFYSGKHFGAISATANEWCKRQRSEQGAAADADKLRR
jgi:hypothetical protein